MKKNFIIKHIRFYPLHWYLFFTCLLVFSLSNVIAQNKIEDGVPNVISFQGSISDEKSSDALTGTYSITFNLYSEKTGGAPVWSETQRQVQLKEGKFQVLFGSNKESNPLNIPFDKKYFIGISINGGKEIKERIELVSTPLSLGSKYAEEVADKSITTEKFAAESVTNEKIKNVSLSKLTNPDPDPDPYSIYWTIQGNIIIGPERNYIGTIEEKNFVIKSFSVQRMLFDPYGHVLMGTVQDSVDFEVIGFSTFSDDMHIKGKMGVGIDTDVSTAKVHINSPDVIPFKIDYQSNEVFSVDKDGHVTITSSADGPDDDEMSYPLYIDSPDQGIAIRVKGAGLLGEAFGGTLIPIPGIRTNSFVTFFDDLLEGRAGRIAGNNAADYALNPKNIALGVYLPILITAEAIAISNATSVNVASILSFGAEIAEIGAQKIYELATLGVSYRSGFADYAEWLERINPNEVINKGDIVGVFSGKISKSTVGADQLLCVSYNPIVLGNMVPVDKEPFYEKVTFLGQVPVKVIGTVNEGDYIITSGYEDGSGIAVSPELMTIDEYSKVVGRAWGSSNYEGVKYVNTTIGFNTREIVSVLKYKENFNSKLKKDISIKNSGLSLAKQKLSDLNEKIDALNLELEILAKEAAEKLENKNTSITVNQK